MNTSVPARMIQHCEMCCMLARAEAQFPRVERGGISVLRRQQQQQQHQQQQQQSEWPSITVPLIGFLLSANNSLEATAIFMQSSATISPFTWHLFANTRGAGVARLIALIARLALTVRVSVRVSNSLGRWYRSSRDRSIPLEERDDDRDSQRSSGESGDEIVARWPGPCVMASTDARGVTTTTQADCIILRCFLHSAVSYAAPSISFSYRSLARPEPIPATMAARP